jgi:hypothetical protein
MGNEASIFVNPASLYMGGNITGEIWLEVEGFEFPVKRWSDFPVIILEWWLNALFEPWSGKEGQGECHFMDGSYSFEVSKEQDAFVLRCYSDPHFPTRRKCEWEGAVDLSDLLRQVLGAASVVIRECQSRSWATPDTEALESRWVQLDGLLNPPSA